jgi:hypothetical protein
VGVIESVCVVGSEKALKSYNAAFSRAKTDRRRRRMFALFLKLSGLLLEDFKLEEK